MLDRASSRPSRLKNNSNHDEHGRFSAGEGGGQGDGAEEPAPWTDEEEADYQASHEKLGKAEQKILAARDKLVPHVKAINDLHTKLGKYAGHMTQKAEVTAAHAEALTEHANDLDAFHTAVADFGSGSNSDLTAGDAEPEPKAVSKAGADTRAALVDHLGAVAALHDELFDHINESEGHLSDINDMLDAHDNTNEEEGEVTTKGRDLHDALDDSVIGNADLKTLLHGAGGTKTMPVPHRAFSKAAFMSTLKSTPMRRAFGASTEALADRQVRVVISTGQIDRSGDVVVQSGISVENFKASRTVLWNHDHDHPIAACLEIGVEAGRLSALVQFPPVGASAKADEIYALIISGVINATSIGFLPLEVEPVDGKNPRKGLRIDTSDLLEFSFVSVPANPGAQVLQRSFGPHRLSSRAPRRKGLQAVQDLARLVQELGYQVDQAADECAREGDASTVPDQLKDCLRQLGAALIAMTSEEVAELIADPDDVSADVDMPTMPMLASLSKTLGALKRRGLAKSGRVLSAANATTLRAHLGAIGDAHQAMVKMIDDATDPLDDDAEEKRFDRKKAHAARNREIETLALAEPV